MSIFCYQLIIILLPSASSHLFTFIAYRLLVYGSKLNFKNKVIKLYPLSYCSKFAQFFRPFFISLPSAFRYHGIFLKYKALKSILFFFFIFSTFHPFPLLCTLTLILNWIIQVLHLHWVGAGLAADPPDDNCGDIGHKPERAPGGL